MSRGRLLVVTTVHQPDDARIRSKLIRTLSEEWDVTFAARDPGPSDRTGLTWHRLAGGRVRRWLTASRIIQSKRWDLVAVHDPELLPPALLRGVLGRPTLFDLHENLPAQMKTKEWVPSALRPALGWAARLLLRWAERAMSVTIAETGYQDLLRREAPVLANHLSPTELPPVQDAAIPPFLAYLGDITEQRGAHLAIAAAAGAKMRLVMVGRVAPPELADRLVADARAEGVDLDLAGPMPHGEALRRIAGASAGISPILDIPNYRHSLPTKVLEYLALGLPALVSDLPGTRAVTDDRPGVIYVAPGEASEWRRAGAELAAQPSLRSATRAAAQSVREAYSWPKEEVLRVYGRVARR
ncbi:MAG: glycosyltransferase [Acidimicrobiia bacterium]